jgi:hypothetical protein
MSTVNLYSIGKLASEFGVSPAAIRAAIAKQGQPGSLNPKRKMEPAFVINSTPYFSEAQRSEIWMQLINDGALESVIIRVPGGPVEFEPAHAGDAQPDSDE